MRSATLDPGAEPAGGAESRYADLRAGWRRGPAPVDLAAERERLLSACDRLRRSEVRRTKSCGVAEALYVRLCWLESRPLSWWERCVGRDAEWLMDGYKADPAGRAGHLGEAREVGAR